MESLLQLLALAYGCYGLYWLLRPKSMLTRSDWETINRLEALRLDLKKAQDKVAPKPPDPDLALTVGLKDNRPKDSGDS